MLSVYRFPIRLGYDVSGIVLATGDAVKDFSCGDEVFSCLPWEYRGSYYIQSHETSL